MTRPQAMELLALLERRAERCTVRTVRKGSLDWTFTIKLKGERARSFTSYAAAFECYADDHSHR